MKRVLSSMAAMCMVLGLLCLPARAITTPPTVSDTITVTRSGQSAAVPVKVTSEAVHNPDSGDGDDGGHGYLSFKVSLPAQLPVCVDANNHVYTASNARIVNLSAGPVEVSNLTLRPASDWTVLPYSVDLSSRPVGEHSVSMKINGLQSTTADRNGNHIRYNQDVFMKAFSDTHNGAKYLWSAYHSLNTVRLTPHTNGIMDITYDLRMAPQLAQMSSVTVADVVFTVSFAYN